MVKIVAVTIVAVLIVCMLGAALLIQNFSSNNGGNSDLIQREASPFQVLDLGNREISSSSDVSVVFHNSAGYSVNVTAISADPVEVPIPVYVDPANGTIERGVVSMETITNGVTTPIEGDLTIDTLPIVHDSPGSLTLAFIDASQSVLNATYQYLNEVKSNSTTCVAASPDLFAEINNYSASLTSLKLGIMDYTSNMIGQLGTVTTPSGNVTLTIDYHMLAICDRIIMAFVDQMNVSQDPVTTGGVEVGNLASHYTLASYYTPDEEKVREWGISLNNEISSDLAAKGTMISKYVGIGAGIVALGACLLGAPALAIGAGVVAAILMFTSTWIPSIYGTALSMGSQMFLDASPQEANAAEPVKYVITNTISNGLSFLTSARIGEGIGEVASATFDILDSACEMTSKMANYVVDAAFNYAASGGTVLPVEPVNPATLNGTWSGTYSASFIGDYGWAFDDQGTITLGITVSNDGSFSGIAYMDGLQIRCNDDGTLVSVSASNGGSVSGTISGNNIQGCVQVTVPGSTTSSVFYINAHINGTTISGDFTNRNGGSGSLTINRQ